MQRHFSAAVEGDSTPAALKDRLVTGYCSETSLTGLYNARLGSLVSACWLKAIDGNAINVNG